MTPQSLTKRQEMHMFLEGALYACGASNWFPATEERRKHFMQGMDAVQTGILQINDPPALQDHIEKVRSGQWPPKRLT